MGDINIPVPRSVPAQGNGGTIRKVVIVLIIVFVIIVAYQIWKAVKTAGDAAGEIAGADIIASKTGISPDRQRVCKSVAGNCENAISRVPFFGAKLWVADTQVVDALNRLVSAEEAQLTCVFFQQMAGESLKGVVEGGFFVESNRRKITYRSSLV